MLTISVVVPAAVAYCSNSIQELARGVRAQLSGLISDLGTADLRPMSLGLSHSLSRYKLKFSPEKVDTMIVQVCIDRCM